MNIWQADGPASIYEKETAVDSDFSTHLKGDMIIQYTGTSMTETQTV